MRWFDWLRRVMTSEKGNGDMEQMHAWRSEEEQKQVAEVRDRLDRVEDQLGMVKRRIERRREHQ